MGKLDINRLSNSTNVNRVDDQHDSLEADLEEILGVPDNTEITASIFGVNPDGGSPVQRDASIRGVPVLKSAAVESDPADAVGFKFDDGTEKRLLCFVNSELKIYKDSDYPNETWTLVASVENPGAGLLRNLADVSSIGDPPFDAGYLLSSVGDIDGSFELVAPSGGSGVTTFIELLDGPGDYGSDGDILVTNATADGVEWQAAPTLEAPFMLYLTKDAMTWTTGSSFQDAYNWSLEDPGSLGLLPDSSDEATYLGNDSGDANKFIKNLPVGVYEASLWYQTGAGSESELGSRQWKMESTLSQIAGPALLGVADRATVGFAMADGVPQLAPIDGMKFLGTKMFIVTSLTSDVKFRIKQDSGGPIYITGMYAVIRKIH